MNEQFPAFHRPIDPALELPFSLGQFSVSPATLELSRDDSVETIEKRMMQVLIALHQRMGEAVSRDALSLLCWEGRIVGDDSLNRVISRLRRALSADPAVTIDTIPKVGYRLRVEGVDQSPSPNPRLKRWTLGLLAAALLLVLLIAAIAWTGRREIRWTADTMRPLTRDAGVEVSPALSPDGRQIAYASSPDFATPTDIYLRGTALGETRPLQITATPTAESSPAWSPDGVRLAYVGTGPGEPCAIIVINPPDSTERIVGRCRDAVSTKIDWLGARAIIFSDGPKDGPWRLFELDIETGQAKPLTSPGQRLLGDSAPSVSPDGRQIAFRRTVTHGNDDILVLDRASGAVRPLGVGGWKGIGIAWASDSRTLFLTSNRGGDFGLWTVDTGRQVSPQRVSQGILPLGQISADRNGNLAVETIRTRANLFAFSEGGRSWQITTSGGNDWDPDVDRKGRIAFGSDVSGSNELWMMAAGEEPLLLTRLQGSYVYSPRWSPDGRRIAFIGVREGRNDVYTIDADGARLRKLTGDGTNKGTVAWSGPADILYTEEGPDGWRVVRLGSAGTKNVVAGGQGLVILRRSPDGMLFGRGIAPAILRLQEESGRLERTDTRISAPIGEAWAAGQHGIYWIDGGFGGPWAIRFTSWNGQMRVVGNLQSLARPALALRPLDGALVAPKLVEGSADLVLFGVQRR